MNQEEQQFIKDYYNKPFTTVQKEARYKQLVREYFTEAIEAVLYSRNKQIK